jgi:hypothetical protein
VAIADNAGGTLPAPWAQMPIGTRDSLGSVRIDQGAFAIDCRGGDLWGERDVFHYLFQPLEGDGRITARLKSFGLKTTTVAKNIGYELRCADPIPLDMEYARDLGYCAAKYLIAGGNAAMISMQGGHFVPVPFDQLLDNDTGRARIRLVDINSTRYAIARRYMIRLRRDDFEDPHELAKFAATAGMSLQQFRSEFATLIDREPPPLQIAVPGVPDPGENGNAAEHDPLHLPPPEAAASGHGRGESSRKKKGES